MLHGVPLLVVVKRTAKRSTAQDGLDELVLPKRLRQIVLSRLVKTQPERERREAYIHLSGKALFTVANHGVSS